MGCKSGRSIEFLTKDRRAPGAITFSPDGALIVAIPFGSRDYAIRAAQIWGTESLQLVAEWREDGADFGEIIGLATFSPDGWTIATTANNIVVSLWNREGELLGTVTGHANRVGAVDWSPDGTRLVTASHDGTAKVWDVSSMVRARSPRPALNIPSRIVKKWWQPWRFGTLSRRR